MFVWDPPTYSHGTDRATVDRPPTPTQTSSLGVLCMESRVFTERLIVGIPKKRGRVPLEIPSALTPNGQRFLSFLGGGYPTSIQFNYFSFFIGWRIPNLITGSSGYPKHSFLLFFLSCSKGEFFLSFFFSFLGGEYLTSSLD